MKIFFRKFHRWLGLLMALQIIAWMASGLYFAIFPIETIRGEHLITEAERLDASDIQDLISPAAAWLAYLGEYEQDSSLESLELHEGMGETWYRITGKMNDKSYSRLVNAKTGEVLQFLDQEKVLKIAITALNVQGKVEATELVTEHSTGSEYRGRSLPLWRVRFSDPESLNLYIDGWTGEIVTRRTTRWRIFDFLWMLHIMDFDERDDFNTPLLQIAAALGLLIALSGVIFWAMTTRLFRSRKTKPVKSTNPV